MSIYQLIISEEQGETYGNFVMPIDPCHYTIDHTSNDPGSILQRLIDSQLTIRRTQE